MLDTYVQNLKTYLRTGVWLDWRWGENQEGKVARVCKVMAYHWEPHDPYLAPEEIIDTYDIDQISLSPSFHDTLDTKPEVLKRMHSVWSGLTDYEWKRIMASYYSSVTYIDSQIERVVDLLKDHDIYDDTLIIFPVTTVIC